MGEPRIWLLGVNPREPEEYRTLRRLVTRPIHLERVRAVIVVYEAPVESLWALKRSYRFQLVNGIVVFQSNGVGVPGGVPRRATA